MNANKNLNTARAGGASDEYYTSLHDIELVMQQYENAFAGKVVYCNCDNPLRSNFVRYFYENFDKLKLKKLIASCYIKKTRGFLDTAPNKPALFTEYAGGSSLPFPDGLKIQHLKGDGDFRSLESVKLLEQCDVVVTNPPFSLFAEHVKQAVKHNKDFLVVGNINGVTYVGIIELLVAGKLFVVYNEEGMLFEIPKELGKKKLAESCNSAFFQRGDTFFAKLETCIWFSNMQPASYPAPLELVKTFDAEKYPKYDYFDDIYVDSLANIPKDYPGVMGVPVTLLRRLNPEQFEILGATFPAGKSKEFVDCGKMQPFLNGKPVYRRLLVRLQHS